MHLRCEGLKTLAYALSSLVPRVGPWHTQRMAVAVEQQVARKGRRLLVLGFWLWVALALLFVALSAFAAFYDYFPADERIAHEIQDIDVPAFGGFVDFVNTLGDAWLYVSLTLLAAIAFATMRAGWASAAVLLTFAPRALNSVLKDLIERPRPSPELLDASNDASGFGFPSGHTVGTAALFGVLFFLIPAAVPWRPLRWLLQLGCLLLVVAAGPARVYVGAHWPSDTLGGYLLALLFLAPLAVAYAAVARRPVDA